MTTIAENVANANSNGYRATGVNFESVLSKTGAQPTAYASPGHEFISRSPGEIIKTDNEFDVAVVGDGWLAIQTPNGVAYTRDGRMQMLGNGQLASVLGYPILDAGRGPILLDPTGGHISISRDGMITQRNQQVSAIGLFSISPDAELTRAVNSSVIPSRPATPILDFINNGVAQGFTENANINPVHELTKLIAASRSFEGASAMYDTLDNAQRNAVRTLGGG
jgi:flagellar basal-body rod protein FlgF